MKFASGLVSRVINKLNNKTMLVKMNYESRVLVNWADPKSIKSAEKQQEILQNCGYSLKKTIKQGQDINILVYEIK